MNEQIQLSLPAAPEYLFLARLNVGAVVSRLDLTVEEIDDLYLAVDELCLSLLGRGVTKPARIDVTVSWSDDQIDVSCRLSGVPADESVANDSPLGSLSKRILDTLVDQYGTTEDDGVAVAWFTKYRQRTPSSS